MATTQTHTLQGPAGKLEMILTQPETAPTATAVLCHPHPLYGGSMHDGVLAICAQALLDAGVAVARFNFRGVGASEGISGRASPEEKAQADWQPPEIGDLQGVIQGLTQIQGTAPAILAGYSFGAHVLWQALTQLADLRQAIETAILVAPPSKAMTFATELSATQVNLHAIWCTQDDYVDPAWIEQTPQLHQHPITGGDHFFSGKGADLANAVTAALATGAG